MADDTTQTTDTTKTAETQGADGKQTSMLDVEKIKAGAKEGTDTTQQGATDKTGPGAETPKGETDKTTQPGEKATRPEYLAEKFWDAEKGAPRLEELNKAYGELEKKFRAGDHKAPEKPEGYKVALDDKQKELLFGAKDADAHKDPLFQQLTGWGVKHKVSQAALDEVLGMYAEATGEEAGKFQIDVAKERQSLGKNADAIIQNQHQFFEQMFKAGEIGEAELKEASILFETASGIKLMQAIRARYGEKSIPTDVDPALEGVPSADELGKMVMDPKYGVDKTFTAKVDGWYNKRYGTAPAMSSVVNK